MDTTNIPEISEQAILQRAQQLGLAQAREQLQAERQKALESARRLEQQKQADWSQRVESTRAAVGKLREKYEARAELAKRIGPLLHELQQMSWDLGVELDRATQDSIAFGVNFMGMAAPNAAQALMGTTPQELHSSIGFKPSDIDGEWSALILKAIVHGNLSIIETANENAQMVRGGRVSVGTHANFYQF